MSTKAELDRLIARDQNMLAKLRKAERELVEKLSRSWEQRRAISYWESNNRGIRIL